MEQTPHTTLTKDPRAGEALAVRRLFTQPGVHPFDTVEWETRTAAVGAFHQDGVEFPATWSQNATNIVAQKYFRGQLDSPTRERSVKQMITRVAGTIADWGRERGYFASIEDGDAFEAELTYVLLHQMAAFNSPVWFNVGFEEQPQCSACLPFHARVSTPEGMVPIGELVEGEQVGREVYDAHGTTRIVAVKHNGRKPVYRVRLRNGQFVEATADHVVKAVHERRTAPEWLRVDELEAGMRMHLHPHRARVGERTLVPAGGFGHLPLDGAPEPITDPVAAAEAALAGWLQADGFVGQYDEGTNRSLTIEFQVASDDECLWVLDNLRVALPDVHHHVREVPSEGESLDVRRIRLYGEVLRPFVERWGLLARGTGIRVPERLFTASRDEIVAYLQSLFQADGYVSLRRDHGRESARIGFAVIGEHWTEDVQLLLNVLGIYSRRLHKPERREDRHDMHEVVISIASERARFAELVGFVGADKQAKLLESLTLRAGKHCPDLREEEIVAIEPVGVQEVYDIQTESGEFLTNNVAVHNCFILSVEDNIESILDWNTREGRIFRGGSGSGINLSKIRGSMEPLSKGGTASGPVSFMRGADAWAGTIKSGGKTRRAAKMVVLDVDHPDIRDFIWCKAREEDKAAALRDAGFDMSIDGDGFHSIQYQNANNSVRVTDEFMHAVENDEDWHLISRTTGEPIGDPVPARELMREIAEAAWRCADPGVQYDTTINQWHTSPNSGRINASNPCFPADARVHTTKGLVPIGQLVERMEAGEQIGVYTHRATAGENGSTGQPGEGVAISTPVAVMRNGVAQIVRLRFANGGELRCTPNHRIWTLNRGYVAAEALTSDDQVMLNDSPTPADDAAWELPVKVTAKAKSFSRGGSVAYADLPERWSESLGEVLGHLVGDGCVTDSSTVLVYGADDVEDCTLEQHDTYLYELFGGGSRQEMDNGTVQLRIGSSAVRELLRGLGVTSARAHDKRVPASIFTAPPEVQAAFLRGLFGADGCVSRLSGNKGYRYVGLGSRSDALLKDVQRLLSTFGIRGSIYPVGGTQDGRFPYVRKDGTEVSYQSRQGYDLRITRSDIERFAVAIGFSTRRKTDALASLLGETTRRRSRASTTLRTREDDGQEHVFNLTEPLHHSYMIDGISVSNCSEYMHVDDSACNLASLNLMKFRRPDGSFDTDRFSHAVDVVFLAQEIIVGPSSYPTEEIGRNARAFRQLGLGYANLGAYLMSNGYAYDSDEGRGFAAAVTALMTGRGYLQSAKVAAAIGPYDRYAENREAHNNVMRMHRDASYAVPDSAVGDAPLLAAARETWDEAVALGELYGYRNAQGSVLAPTGTISFLMDCDTTGIEPDFSLVKYKELVGGGTMTIVNRTVPMALRTLGYTDQQVEQIEAYINEHGTIVGAPGLAAEHLPVFDVAVGERAISHAGHIKMMGAVQPFLSGAISKTVNMPQTATVEDIAEAYLDAWKLGVKALAIYRDGSKTAQALRTDAQEVKEVKEVKAKAEAAISAGEEVFTGAEVEARVQEAVAEALEAAAASTAAGAAATAAEAAATVTEPTGGPARRRMPRERKSLTHKFSLGGHEGYITAGMYDDGTVGEIFLTDIGKEGSTLRGMMNSFATAISIALQYGVPLETLVSKFAYMRFEPEGITTNPEIPFAKSMPDYIMRWLASRFLDADAQEELGILTPEVRARMSGADVSASAAGGTAGPANGIAGPGNGQGTAPGPATPTGAAGALAPGVPAAGGPASATGAAPATPPSAQTPPTTALTDTPPVVPARMVGLDLGPACSNCGGMMQRTGSCYTCSSCGSNTGCG